MLHVISNILKLNNNYSTLEVYINKCDTNKVIYLKMNYHEVTEFHINFI